MINFDSILELNDVPASFAAVNHFVAILNTAGVVGVHHGDFDVADFLRAALVHHGDFLGAFFFQPAAEFGNAD